MMTTTVWRLSGELSMDRTLRLEAANERVADTFGVTPPTLSYFEQRHTPLWKVEIFFDGEPTGDCIAKILGAADLIDWPYRLEAMADKDWVSESQKLLDPVEAGRFYVHGSHDSDKDADGTVNLTVDAGQAFGTGRHETTWACLKLLDGMEEFGAKRVLDLGTGSGVLAMAALRLWRGASVLATDIDTIAVEVTKDNVKGNSCRVRRIGEEKPGIATLAADGFNDPAFRVEGPFDLVIANILAGPLVTLAEDIERVTRHGGRIMLSGLLATQEEEVASAYRAQGLEFKDKLEHGEWLALLFEKP